MYNDINPEQLTINPVELDSNTFVATIDNYSKQITDYTQRPSNSDKTLITVYEEMNKKYNLNIDYTNFKDFLTSIADKDKLTSAFEDILGSKVISEVSKRVKLKAIVTVGNLIEKALDLMDRQVETAYEPSFDLVVYIDKVMQWVDQLATFEENNKLGDPDRMLRKTANEINKVSSAAESVETKREKERELSDLVQAIVTAGN
jgi:hypothetical protein